MLPIPATRVSDPPASAWEWTQAGLLAANLAWTTLGRGGYPPGVMLVTASLTAALLVVHLVARAREPVRLHPAGWWLVPFLVYAWANARWVSPVPWLAWRDWIGWAQMAVVFWVVLNGIRGSKSQRFLFLAIVALAIVGVLLGAYQTFVDKGWQMLGGVRSSAYRGRASGSFGMPNSLAAVFLLVGPPVAALAFRRTATAAERVWWGWVTIVLAFGFILTIARGAWIALAIALAAWPLCAGRGRWTRRLRISAVVSLCVVAVGVWVAARSPEVRARFAQLVLDAGERTRPIMWRGAWALFREEPVIGTGAASYNVLFEKHRPEGFRDEPLWPHNEYLHLLSDYGIVGFALFLGACGVIVMRCVKRPKENLRRRDWLDSPTLLGGLGIGMLAFALQLAIEFHFKIPALAMMFATVAALAVSRAWRVESSAAVRTVSPRIVSGVLAVGFAAGFAWVLLPKLRAEALRKPARQAIDRLAGVPANVDVFREPLRYARAALSRATAIDPANGQAWSDLSYAIALWSHVEPARHAELGRDAEAAAERALACSRVCGEFWVRRGAARDLQGRWVEAGDDFSTAVKLAPANAIMWYYYADHLSRRPGARDIAVGALAFCLRLDPSNPAALALRQDLAKSPGR